MLRQIPWLFDRNSIRRLIALAAVFPATLMLGVSAAAAAGDAAKGAMLAGQHCNACHSVGPSETARKADAGPQFAELAKKSPGYLAVAINRPHDFMPKFPELSKQDKDDLVAYIRTVK